MHDAENPQRSWWKWNRRSHQQLKRLAYANLFTAACLFVVAVEVNASRGVHAGFSLVAVLNLVAAAWHRCLASETGT